MAKSKYWNGTSWEVLGTDASKVVEETDKRFMTDAEKTKLAGIQAGAQVNTVTSVAGKTGAVTVTKSDVGLGSVENYGIATQAEAQAGTSDVKYMTPSKVKDAINYQGFSRYVSGSYVGDGASLRTINIGVRPVRLIVHPTFDNGSYDTLYYILSKVYKSISGEYLYPNSSFSVSGTSLIINSTFYNKLNETFIWEAWY